MRKLFSNIGWVIWAFIEDAFLEMNIYKFFLYVFSLWFGYNVLGNIF